MSCPCMELCLFVSSFVFDHNICTFLGCVCLEDGGGEIAIILNHHTHEYLKLMMAGKCGQLVPYTTLSF